MLNVAVKDALEAGFAGLCAAGDMSWLLDEAHGATHPYVRLEGNLLLENPFYEPPAQAASRRSDGSALHGKLEWLKSALAALLGGRSPEAAPVRIRA